jgi:hypothetical protein
VVLGGTCHPPTSLLTAFDADEEEALFLAERKFEGAKIIRASGAAIAATVFVRAKAPLAGSLLAGGSLFRWVLVGLLLEGQNGQNENLTEPCIVRGALVLVTRPKFAFV